MTGAILGSAGLIGGLAAIISAPADMEDRLADTIYGLAERIFAQVGIVVRHDVIKAGLEDTIKRHDGLICALGRDENRSAGKIYTLDDSISKTAGIISQHAGIFAEDGQMVPGHERSRGRRIVPGATPTG